MPSRGAGSQHSVAAKDGKKKGTAAGKAAAGQKGNGSLLGVRVRVQCSDGAFYEGKVTGWDPALAEWQILLDDGDELSSPIDENTWDVTVISEAPGDTPEVRRTRATTSSSKQNAGKSDASAVMQQGPDAGSDDDLDFVESPRAFPSSKEKQADTSAGSASAAKRRKLNYGKIAAPEGFEGAVEDTKSNAEKGKNRRKGPGASAGGKKPAAERAEETGVAKARSDDSQVGRSKQDALIVDSDDDFALMQPKPKKIVEISDDDGDDVPLKRGKVRGAGVGKGAGKGKKMETGKGKGKGKGKEAVYVCERGCGFEGDHGQVEAHEQVCGYVRGDQWESDMDSEEEEEFLSRWEASVERQINCKAEPPQGLLMPLLPFQLESLAWMSSQEGSKYKGGILADEMGMGKTIQAISLIMANRAQKGQVKSTLVVCPLVAMVQWRGEIERYCAAGSLSLTIYHGPKRVTSPAELTKYDVVLTTYAIVQSEFSSLSRGHKVSCPYCNKKYLPPQLKIHHKFFCGPTAQRSVALAKTDKKKGVARRASGGAGSSSSGGKSEKGGKKRGVRKGKRAKDESSEESQDESDEEFVPDEDSEEEDEVAPVSARRSRSSQDAEEEEDEDEEEEYDDDDDEKEEDTDEDDAKKRVKGKAAAKGKGGKGGDNGGGGRWAALKKAYKKIDKKEYFKDWAAARKEEKDLMDKITETARAKSTLHSVKWHRIVLDEAHTIKDKSCATAKSVFALEAESRWALSGTPLQNRVSELFSLIRFLRVDPYSYYFDKTGQCKSLNWDMGPSGKHCEHCGKHRINHFCWWNKHIMNPIAKFGYSGPGRTAMLRLKHEVLDRILLRRTKDGRSEDIVIPPKHIVLRKDPFDPFEADYYQSVYTQSQTQFNAYVSAGTVLNNYAHIFDLLIRLRQAVNHPYLVQYSEKNYLESRKGGGEGAGDGSCGLCKEPCENPVVTGCRHSFCRACLEEYMDSSPSDPVTCPSCEKALSVDLHLEAPAVAVSKAKVPPIIHRIESLEDFRSSSKIEALLEELELLAQEDPCAKAIVFSQFVSMLDLIEHRLRLAGVEVVKIDGRMSFEMREKYINRFTSDASTRVFLISLKAGGVALNLTVASAVYIMDPWWNPAAEFQAMDRIHRLGQFKPIKVVRFVVENTIEDRILRLQEKKRLVFESTIGRSNAALTKLTEADMQFLFK